MPDKTYKIIEVVGVSDDSVQQAVRNAITKARQTIRNIDWFEVEEYSRLGEQGGRSDFPGGSADRLSAGRRRRSLKAILSKA